MVRIIADTATMISPAQGAEEGILIAPLSVTIDGKSYLELVDIFHEEFLDIIAQGHIPTSSQPAVGEFVRCYESLEPDEEAIVITMGQGLSATYDGALTAKGMVANGDNITVVNSRSLCGPERFMARMAAKMAAADATKEEILAKLQEKIDNTRSFLMVEDFDYLRRGGRINALAANMVGKLKIIPVVVQAADGTHLAPFKVGRKVEHLVRDICNDYIKRGIGKDWLITISQAANMPRAELAKGIINEMIPEAEVEISDLTPVFITQGGPLCMSIQAVNTL